MNGKSVYSHEIKQFTRKNNVTEIDWKLQKAKCFKIKFIILCKNHSINLQCFQMGKVFFFFFVDDQTLDIKYITATK